MIPDWLKEIAEAELPSDHIGHCDGPCERDGVVTTLWGGRDMSNSNYYNLCYWCAREYNEHWDEMWAMYWSDRL